MCNFGGKGGFFNGGSIGGILGSLGAGALDIAFPEIGIPLSLATAAGGFIGGTAGGVASGEDFGKAALGGVESGAISGLTAGAGNVIGGGDFFGAPATSIAAGPAGAAGEAGPLGDVGAVGGALAGSADPIIGGAAPTLAGGDIGALPAATAGVGGTSVTPAAGVPASVTGGGFDPTGNANIDSILSSASSNPANSNIAADITADPTGTGAGRGISGFGSDVLHYAGEHPFQLAGAGALALPLLMGGGKTPGLTDIQNQANLEAQQGNQLSRALQTGQLPQGAQAALDNAMQAAKATARSNFAGLGISGSTQEAQALSGIDQTSAAQKFKMLTDVTNTGLTQVGAADSLYKTIMQTELSQDAQTSAAIARIAAALAGGGVTKAAA